jgi:hypothetical protein
MTDAEQHLSQLEEDLLQPRVRRSADAMSSLLADEFYEFGSSGHVFNKQQIIEALRMEEPAQFSVLDLRAQILAAGVALVTYRAIRRSESNQQVSESLRSSLWAMRGSRWQMLFHQGTKAPGC